MVNRTSWLLMCVVMVGCGSQQPEPSCVDGAKNGSETDVDCGGSCGKCFDGRACQQPMDCLSGLCTLLSLIHI